MEKKSYETVLDENGYILWKCTGISMLPLICESRDYVYIKKCKRGSLKKYDVVLFTREDENSTSYILHRILKDNKDGTFYIAGDNCFGGDIVKEENIIGILYALKRNGKVIEVTDFGYRVYSRMWHALYPLRVFCFKLIAVAKKIKRHVIYRNK